MSPVGDWGEEEDPSHVCTGGHSFRHSQVGDLGGLEDLSYIHSGRHSVTHVPSGGWWKRGGSQPCMQWGMLSDTCPQRGMEEERGICAIYAVGDTQ